MKARTWARKFRREQRLVRRVRSLYPEVFAMEGATVFGVTRRSVTVLFPPGSALESLGYTLVDWRAKR